MKLMSTHPSCSLKDHVQSRQNINIYIYKNALAVRLETALVESKALSRFRKHWAMKAQNGENGTKYAEHRNILNVALKIFKKQND